jgi:hypothetical protein
MSERHLAVAILAPLVFAVASGASGQVQPTLVGILEDNPGHYAGNPPLPGCASCLSARGKRMVRVPEQLPRPALPEEHCGKVPGAGEMDCRIQRQAVLCVNTRPRMELSASQILLAHVERSSVEDAYEVPNETMVARIGNVVYVCRLLHAAAG